MEGASIKTRRGQKTLDLKDKRGGSKEMKKKPFQSLETLEMNGM